jgi:hypothetical protein
MIVEYLFVYKINSCENLDFLEDFIKFSDVSLKLKDRMYFYVKKNDKIISNFVVSIMSKFKTEMEFISENEEYNILKYKLFKLFSERYPEIVLDTNLKKLNIVNIKCKKSKRS